MKLHLCRMFLCFGLCFGLFCALSFQASAQGKGPGGGPPGGHSPGGMGGMGGGFGGLSGAGNAPPGFGSGGSRSAARTGIQIGPAGRWWDDRSVAQTIGLRKDQQKKMDEIFGANEPAIVDTYKTFLSEKSKQEALSKQPQVDQSRMFAAIDSVSQARASLEKAYTQMLLQIRQQLDADQIQKLERLQ